MIGLVAGAATLLGEHVHPQDPHKLAQYVNWIFLVATAAALLLLARLLLLVGGAGGDAADGGGDRAAGGAGADRRIGAVVVAARAGLAHHLFGLAADHGHLLFEELDDDRRLLIAHRRGQHDR